MARKDPKIMNCARLLPLRASITGAIIVVALSGCAVAENLNRILDNEVRERKLFTALVTLNEEAHGKPIALDLKAVYGPSLKRFAVQCSYGTPKTTAKELGLPEQTLINAGLEDYTWVNSESIAALILEFDSGELAISEWDWTSISWCNVGRGGWREDTTVAFQEVLPKMEDYDPVFQAFLPDLKPEAETKQ